MIFAHTRLDHLLVETMTAPGPSRLALDGRSRAIASVWAETPVSPPGRMASAYRCRTEANQRSDCRRYDGRRIVCKLCTAMIKPLMRNAIDPKPSPFTYSRNRATRPGPVICGDATSSQRCGEKFRCFHPTFCCSIIDIAKRLKVYGLHAKTANEKSICFAGSCDGVGG